MISLYSCRRQFDVRWINTRRIWQSFLLASLLSSASVGLADAKKLKSAEELIELLKKKNPLPREIETKPLTRGLKIDRGIAGIRSGNESANQSSQAAKSATTRTKNSGARLGFSNILFTSGSSTLAGESFPQLDELGTALAVLLSQDSDISFVIEGHTDSQGSQDANLELSRERASVIRRYLQVNFDIDSKRLKSVGYGEQVPVASNNDEDGRRLNRRVEIVVK